VTGLHVALVGVRHAGLSKVDRDHLEASLRLPCALLALHNGTGKE
jgi:hypothetical protein